MKNREINKLAMYHAVQAFLTKTETDALPKLGEKRAAFITLLSKIDALSTRQAQPTFGLVGDRDRAFAEVEATAVVVAGVARSYAEAAQLGDLAARMRVRPSHLQAMRLPQRLQLARRVHDEVLPHAAVLVDHGLTSVILADFKAKLDAAATLLAQPRAALVLKQEATKHLHTAVREMDRFLERQLDPMLLLLGVSNPEAHSEYLRARKIVARAATRATGAEEEAAAPVALRPAA
jgi:hypothetical protein